MDNSRLDKLLKHYSGDVVDPFIVFALAKEYEKIGDLASSLKYYEELRKDFPDYVGTYFHLAQLYGEIDQIQEAVVVYNEGIQKAEEQKDQHALSELKNAKLNFEMENGL